MHVFPNGPSSYKDNQCSSTHYAAYSTSKSLGFHVHHR